MDAVFSRAGIYEIIFQTRDPCQYGNPSPGVGMEGVSGFPETLYAVEEENILKFLKTGN